jgi:DNA-binding response OmpR family regulator
MQTSGCPASHACNLRKRSPPVVESFAIRKKCQDKVVVRFEFSPARRQGADDYIIKPIDFDVLHTIINARLARVARTQRDMAKAYRPE